MVKKVLLDIRLSSIPFKLYAGLICLMVLALWPIPSVVGDYAGIVGRVLDLLHFIVFFVLVFAFDEANWRKSIWLLIGIIFAIEALQFITSRTPDAIDIVLGLWGMLTAYAFRSSKRVLGWVCVVLFAFYGAFVFGKPLGAIVTNKVSDFEGPIEWVEYNQLGISGAGNLSVGESDLWDSKVLSIPNTEYPWRGVRFDYDLPLNVDGYKYLEFDFYSEDPVSELVVKLENKQFNHQIYIKELSIGWTKIKVEVEASSVSRITSLAIFMEENENIDTVFLDNVSFNGIH